MNLYERARDYLRNVLLEEKNLKCLFLDEQTFKIVNMLFYKSELYNFKVFDSLNISTFDQIECQAKTAVLVLKPNEDNILQITQSLSRVSFENVRVCKPSSRLTILDFTNSVSNFHLQNLAESDSKNIVRCVKEIFLDFIPNQPDFFTLDFPLLSSKNPKIIILQGPDGKADFKESDKHFLKQSENSLFSIFLAFKSIPSIRYSSNSSVAKKIAERVSSRLEREYTQNHKDFSEGTMDLLVLDRRDDPISPLIYNWSYFSLVDELIGIENNSVTIPSLGNKNEIFSRNSGDDFLDEFWLKNYGDTSKELAKRLKESSKKRHVDLNKASLEDMKDLMLKMPEVTKQLAEIKKHAEIFKIINEEIQDKNMYELSGLQQDIAVESDKGEQFEAVLEMINNSTITDNDKIKLCMLYCIKYSNDDARINGLKNVMRQRSLMTDHIDKILSFCKNENRKTDDFFTKGSKFFATATTSIMSKLKSDNPNYYERHKPKCVEFVDLLLKRKLKTVDFPQIDLRFFNDNANRKSRRIVVFIVGGATYLESRELQVYSQKSGCSIILGSNFILNSKL